MNNKLLIEAAALRQYKHNDGSEGFVCAWDLEITNRVVAHLEAELRAALARRATAGTTAAPSDLVEVGNRLADTVEVVAPAMMNAGTAECLKRLVSEWRATAGNAAPDDDDVNEPESNHAAKGFPCLCCNAAPTEAEAGEGGASALQAEPAGQHEAVRTAVWTQVTGAGQVKEGDKLRFAIGDKAYRERAKLILNPGTDKEEVIYDKGRNFYFITSMVVSGKSNHKGVQVLASGCRKARHTNDNGSPEFTATTAPGDLPKWIDAMKGSDPTMDGVIEYIEKLLASNAGAAPGCACRACNPHMVGRMMFICPTCGDKRCPHALDHSAACAAAPSINPPVGAAQEKAK